MTKEIMALDIAIATRGDSCIGFHVKPPVRLGLTRAELLCIFGQGAGEALAAFDTFSGD